MELQLYNMKVNVWNHGVILYILVLGTLPFIKDRKCCVSHKIIFRMNTFLVFALAFVLTNGFPRGQEVTKEDA